MNDNPENAGNGGPESLREVWRKRARNSRNTMWCYSGVVVALFIIACAIVVFADSITRKTVDIASDIAVEESERLEERLTLPRRFDFRGAALGRRDDTVFAVGDDGYILAADSGSGLREWESLPGNTGKNFRGIAVSDDGGVVIAAGRRGLVRRSVDRGQTWTDPGIVAAQDVNAVALSGDGGTAILVGDDGLVRRSVDGGRTWRDPSVVQDGKGRPEDINAVALSRNGNGQVVAVLVGDDGLVRRSVDGGQTWTDPGIVRTEKGKRKDVNAVALSDDGKVAVLVGDDGLAGYFTNGGATWKSCATNVGDDLNAVALSRDGKTAVAAGDDGLVLIFDVQKEEGCSDVRGGNTGTPHRLHALVLDEDEDSDEGVIAIFFGGRRTIVRSDVSSSPPKGGPVGGLRVSKPLEEPQEEPQEESRDPKLSDLSWQLYLYSAGLRVGIIVILMFWVGHLAGLIRYHLRLAAHHDARRDAIVLVGEKLSSEPSDGLVYLERTIDALSPDGIGFSDAKVQRNKLLALPRAAGRAVEEAAKDLQGDER